MAIDFHAPRLIRFGIFEMDMASGEIRKNGARLKLQGQPFRVLEFLALRAGMMVPREEIYCLLSGHSTYDSKHALNNAIQKIREALNDSSDNPRFIETVMGRGYRFLPNVELIPANDTHEVRTWSAGDLFTQGLAQIRSEFLSTDSLRKLRELVHRANGLMTRYPQHPATHEAQLLIDDLQGAFEHSLRSEHNRRKHHISFYTAARVFDDPDALTISRRLNAQEELCRTVGRVSETRWVFPRSVLVTVAHSRTVTGDGQEVIGIRSARKATEAEKRAYEDS